MMRRRHVGILAAVIVLALVGGVFAWAGARRTDEIIYVTAPVSRGVVTETFVTSGTVSLESRATLTFDQPGVVEAVPVRIGDPVRAGDTIASLEPAPLHLAVLQARAQLLAAKARLDADRAGQPAGAMGLGGLGGMSGLPGGLPGGMPGGSGSSGKPGLPDFSGMEGSLPPEVAELQGAMDQLQRDLVAQQRACKPVMGLLDKIQGGAFPTLPSIPQVSPPATGEPEPSASPSPDETPAPTTTPTAEETATEQPSPEPTEPATTAPPPSPTPTASPRPTSIPTGLPSELVERIVAAVSDIRNCLSATTALGQSQLNAGLAMQGAAEALARTQTEVAKQLEKASKQIMSAAEAAGRQAAEQALEEAQRRLADQAQLQFGGQVTDATLASDRLAVLQAQQQVDRAERQLAAGTITSPIDGVVGALDLAVGESSAGRSAVIVGPGGASISVEVPLSVRPYVANGMEAMVGPVAQPLTLTGTVSSVSVLPSSGSGDPTFTATVFVPDPQRVFANGVRADVSLQLRRSEDALFVPASALTRTSDTAGTVEVVSAPTDSTARTVLVEIGATGGGRVEITSGLSEGQLVVLADRRLPVPGDLMQYEVMRPTMEPTPSPSP